MIAIRLDELKKLILKTTGGFFVFGYARHEEEQHLILYPDGRMYFSRFFREMRPIQDKPRDAKRSKKAFRKRVKESVASYLIAAVRMYFDINQYVAREEVCDAGIWQLTLIYCSGKEERYSGPAIEDLFIGSLGLSVMMRCLLGIPELWAFDGHGREPADPKKGELIFAFVRFGDYGGKTFTYLSDDPDIREGDRVVVPAGPDNEEKTAVVDEVKTLPPEQAPYPVERCKKIIRVIKSI